MKNFSILILKKNRQFCTFVLCSLLAAESSAQIQVLRKARPRAECVQVCNEKGLSRPKFGAKLDKIRAEIANETDPEKLKILREKEKEEFERATEKLASFCESTCENNPE